MSNQPEFKRRERVELDIDLRMIDLLEEVAEKFPVIEITTPEDYFLQSYNRGIDDAITAEEPSEFFTSNGYSPDEKIYFGLELFNDPDYCPNEEEVIEFLHEFLGFNPKKLPETLEIFYICMRASYGVGYVYAYMTNRNKVGNKE
jgi:hypothetical protein